MDSILPDLPAIGSFFGVLGLLAWLIVHLHRQASSDRRDYQATLQNLRQRHVEDTTAAAERSDSDAERLRMEIQRLRGENDVLREQLDKERDARWKAEDAAARWRRIAGEGADEPPASTS